MEFLPGVTPPKINLEPENDGLEDDFPLPGVYSHNLLGCSQIWSIVLACSNHL